MADNDPSKQARSEIERRSIGREILTAAAQEMGFAVNSIRQEVVEKGWFGEKVTPEIMLEWERGGSSDRASAGAQDFSREDLYGRAPERSERELGPERDRDQELDR